MSELEKLFKKFEEPEESDFTSAYESDKKEEKKLSPQITNIEDINNREYTKLGTYIEDYFYLKLKKYLKSKNDFRGNYSIIKHIQKIKDSILNYILEKTQSNDEESNKIKIVGIDLIKKVEETFKTKSKNLQIDSFFPCVSGKIVKDFYNKINDYSLSSNDFLSNIREENTYNLLIESTHSITAQINKKAKQLKGYFQLFYNTKKLYLDNKEILKDFYIEFLKYFKVIEVEENNKLSDGELINKSNYIYIICSNKNYAKTKLFQESMKDKNKLNNLVEMLSPSDAKKSNEQSIKNENKTKSGKEMKKIDNIRELKDKKNGKNNDDKNSKEGAFKNGEEGQKEKEKNNENVQKNGENFKEEDQKEVEVNSEETSKDKKKGKKSVKKKSKKIKTDNDSSSNNEENDYNPSKYIDKFKKILEKIGKEEKYLLIYLDSYDRLFIPYSVIKDDLKLLKEKYQNFEKNFDAKYEKLKNESEQLKKEYEQFKKESEEKNKDVEKLKKLHPELFK